MSIETLKQHTSRKIEELTEKKAELHGKLIEKGVLNLGWSIIPGIVGVELELQDWTTVSRVIDKTGPLSTDNNNWANTVAQRLTLLIEREKESHCDAFYLPNSSSQLSNIFELYTINNRPDRWKVIRFAVDMALE